MANAGSVQASVGIAPPGSRLALTYLRNGREASTTLTVEERAPSDVVIGRDAVIAHGATLRADADGEVQVAAVEAGSTAAHAGLTAGDRLTAVDGGAVSTLAQAGSALNAGGLNLEVMRGDDRQEIVLRPRGT